MEQKWSFGFESAIFHFKLTPSPHEPNYSDQQWLDFERSKKVQLNSWMEIIGVNWQLTKWRMRSANISQLMLARLLSVKQGMWRREKLRRRERSGERKWSEDCCRPSDRHRRASPNCGCLLFQNEVSFSTSHIRAFLYVA